MPQGERIHELFNEASAAFTLVADPRLHPDGKFGAASFYDTRHS